MTDHTPAGRESSVAAERPFRRWQDIDPADAVDLDLAADLTITAPLNENGERCPWPWEPQPLVDVPLGQYHCPSCGAMCVAGLPYPDYGPELAGRDQAARAPAGRDDAQEHEAEAG
jgi:hypothetical protein